ncbi:O-acetyl-ADP-ribose deacetylase, partial [Dissostichus eleginoides]
PKLDMTPISSWSRGGPRLSHSAQTQGGWKAGREKELKDCEGGREEVKDSISLIPENIVKTDYIVPETMVSIWFGPGHRVQGPAVLLGRWHKGQCAGSAVSSRHRDISLKALLGAKGPAQLSLKPNQPE